MKFRNIGPYRGGRVTAVTGVVGDFETYYMGSTGGGVWKTTDAGVSWKNISDKHFAVASVGAIAVAESDPNVIYVGTGSACPRGNVSPGIGVYRSTDAGKTWTHVGLDDVGQIARIRVHPQDPDLVYVAALGHIFGPNEERGVFRSTDGGETWEKVLFVSDRAGAGDLAMSPHNPRILFAGIWEVERKPWTMESGGEDGGLYRSTDGGDSWEELSEGLPEGMTGRIGVTVSAANPDRVWALIEAEEGGLFRSEDGGEEFRLINSDRNFRQRAWYYTHVFADPQDPETVYILNVGMWRSVDGGKSFSYIRAPHGDHHDLWIQPENAQILINGNDGGANVSFNGGKTWSSQAIQPTAEMYRVTVDDQFPYRVYGCQQDNSCVSLPSRTSSSGIARQDWWVIGGCESGHVAVDPRNPEITYSGCYGGSIGRYDHATDQEREIMAYPQLAVGQAARDLKYRFQWNAPIRLSPHDPSVLYHTSQYVHRSTDEGQSWEVISPDLTRNDPDKQDYAGGDLTWDNTGVEVYDTIFAFEESVQTPGLLWAGTDDGRVHISRDNGANWEEITPAGMPDWGQVNTLELSAHDPGRAFLAVTRYRLDDFRPYIFRTNDYGATWTQIADGSNGIPEDHFVRVVREDPDRKGLLYAGTEFGLYISFDDGASWRSFQLELPVTPITDLAVAHQDLVVATQGRSFWILDDLTPLHQLSGDSFEGDVQLFAPRDTYRFGGGFSFGDEGVAGRNPPAGVMIHYYLDTEPEEEVTLEILDAEGDVLRTLSSTKEEPQAPSPWRQFFPAVGGARKLEAKEGLNRYDWNLRLHDAELVEDAVLWGFAQGPKVPPGTYQARLSVGDSTQTTSFRVKADPRLDTSQSDFDAQFGLAKSIWQSTTDSHTALGKIRDIRGQVEDIRKRLDAIGKGEGVAEAAETVNDRLSEIEKKIYQTRNEAGQDILNYPPKLDNQLLGLMFVVESGDARPTDGSVQRYQELAAELDGLETEIDSVVGTELAAFDELVRQRHPAAVIVP
ncbi:MAG: glycosyl hydrolase [Acidobacteria bacterium]|nr:MAG: glycosyl hydrolase [Acidobacteriota bacterium]